MGHAEVCARKRRHRTELDARLAMVSAQRSGLDVKRVYKCPVCKGWHLTSKKK